MLARSAPARTQLEGLHTQEMVLNMGPQHPSTHGVLRLEIVTDGEMVVDVVPHLGYMHRCFEKHAESLTYQQIIPYVDRIDYLAAMNGEWAFIMGVEQMMGLTGKLPKRIEYIRVLVAELNRIASHLVAIGTFGLDVGAWTPFLWCMRDREHILNMLEWASGARLLYNYLWVGGLYYDLPVGFEQRAAEFADYFSRKLPELDTLLTTNHLFVKRTAGVGVLPLGTAVNYAASGPILRASGLRWDLRRIDGYSVYPELEFDTPVGKNDGQAVIGDTWNRYWVRAQEMKESVKIIRQCVAALLGEHKRTPDFDPRAMCPKKLRPTHTEYYSRAENPRGETGFYFIGDPKRDIPYRCKARGASFCNLSLLPEISRGVLIADLVAIVGSLDFVLCEVDR